MGYERKISFIERILLFVVLLFAVIIMISIYLFCSKEKTAVDIFEDNVQSIVEIKAFSEGVGESFGTAVFVDSKGVLVTNAHVVTYMQQGNPHLFDTYLIRMATEEEYREVDLLAYDNAIDVAVLRTTNLDFNFKPIVIGNCDNLKSGQTVYAIGNVVNYGLSISHGLIGIPLIEVDFSGVTRSVIQCDISIAEGSSGGALLDNLGRIIGLTTFRTKNTSGDVVHGFAYSVPINIIIEYLSSEKIC